MGSLYYILYIITYITSQILFQNAMATGTTFDTETTEKWTIVQMSQEYDESLIQSK